MRPTAAEKNANNFVKSMITTSNFPTQIHYWMHLQMLAFYREKNKGMTNTRPFME